MSRKLSTAIVFAIAVVFAAAPFVLAQTAPSGQAGTGTTTAPLPQSGTGSIPMPSSQMSTIGMDTLRATVADVNHQHNTLKLKMQGGETVEFKVPEASLAHLTKGDSVQVSIRKAELHPGTGAATQPVRPESSPSGSNPKPR